MRAVQPGGSDLLKYADSSAKRGGPMKSIIRISLTIITSLMLAGLLPMLPGVQASYSASALSCSPPFGNRDMNGNSRTAYTQNERFAGTLIANGIDISAYQSTRSNMKTAKRNGADFAILRVTWTGYTKLFHSYRNNDSSFRKNFAAVKAAGMQAGAYVFSQAKTEDEAADEALFAVKRLKALGIGPEDMELPLYMDYEFAGPRAYGRLYGISKAQATACAKAFCEVVRNCGYQPGIYASTSFFKDYIDTSKLGKDVDIWCAQYWYKCNYRGDYSKWQYSSTSRVPGILDSSGNDGSTDTSFWYIDKAEPGKGGALDFYGSRNVRYTGGAVLPVISIYDGARRLKEGVDYTLSGIGNVRKSSEQSYVYVRGIGRYSGYALIPFSIGGDYVERMGMKECGAGLENATETVVRHRIRFINDGREVSSEYYKTGTPADRVALPEPPVKSADDGYTYEFAGWMTSDGNGIAAVTGPAEYFASYRRTPIRQTDDEPAETSGSADLSLNENANDTEPAVRVTLDTSLPDTDKKATLRTERKLMNLSFASVSGQSFVRNIPRGTTVSQLLKSIRTVKGTGDGLSLKVINCKGKVLAGTATVATGQMIGAFRGSRLEGTAEIHVKGSTLNSRVTDRLRKSSPAKVRVASVRLRRLRARKKGFTAEVYRKSKAYVTGYQLRYSRYSTMKHSKKLIIGKKASDVSQKVTGLRSGRKYYVQVRGYKVVNGKRHYSSWSRIRSIKAG